MRVRISVPKVVEWEEIEGEMVPRPRDFGQPEAVPDGLISLTKAAAILRISPGTIRNWVSAGTFSADHGLTRIGNGRGRPRVSRQKLMRAIEQGKLHTEHD